MTSYYNQILTTNHPAIQRDSTTLTIATITALTIISDITTSAPCECVRLYNFRHITWASPRDDHVHQF